MFKIDYRIAKNDYDEFIGDKGYYKMSCNKNIFGEFYPEELEEVMGTEYLFLWFEDMMKVALALHDNNYVALRYIESHVWIEFVRSEDSLSISLVYSDDPNVTDFIVYEPPNKRDMESLWKDEIVSFTEFRQELIRVVAIYADEIKNNNLDKYSLLQGQLHCLSEG